MASQLIVQGATAPLFGSVPLPCDEGVSLCRVALAALARGKTTLRMRSLSSGVETLLLALRDLGIESTKSETDLVVFGRGLFDWVAPTQVMDLRGNCEVGALMLGLCVSRPFVVELWVDDWVAELLVPTLAATHPLVRAPLGDEGQGVRISCESVAAGHRAAGQSVICHGVFPWVKQAVLLAGVRAGTPTTVEEKMASADHLERAMLRCRLPLVAEGTVATLHPPRDEDAIAPQTYDAIGSASLFAPLCAAAGLVPGSRVVTRNRLQNPTRNDFVMVAKWAGLPIVQQPSGDRQGEPVGDVEVNHATLRAVSLSGESVLRLGDEAMFLLALMAKSRGRSSLADWLPRARGGQQRLVGRVVGLLRSAGVEVSADEQIVIEGTDGAPLRPLTVTTGGHSSLALLASVLALGAAGTSTIDDVDCLRGHFPRWVGTLRALGAAVEVKQG